MQLPRMALLLVGLLAASGAAAQQTQPTAEPADRLKTGSTEQTPPAGEPGRAARPLPDDPWDANSPLSEPSAEVARPALRPAATDDGVVRRSQSTIAAVGGGEAVDRIPVWLRTSASLAGVVALIVLLAWGYRLVAGAGGKLSLGGSNRHPGLVEKLSRVNLSPRQSLYLVRVGPQLVLIGATHDSLRALSIINDPNLAAQFAGRQAQLGAGSHQAEFNRWLESEAGAYPGGGDGRRDGEIPDVARTVSLKQKLAQTVERLKSMA